MGVLMSYLVHASTHVLVRLTHGNLLAERANCRGNPNIMLLSRQAPTNDIFVQILVNMVRSATEATIERTFFLLLGLLAAASFQLLLHNPLLCHLRGVGSAQSGHQPRVKEL